MKKNSRDAQMCRIVMRFTSFIKIKREVMFQVSYFSITSISDFQEKLKIN
jgi:hypothetical protein